MSLWSRIANVFRAERLSRAIHEEFESHIQEAINQGRDPAEARQSFGPALRHLDDSHDLRVLPWLDSLRADAIFGWRQLKKNKVTSGAAVLSLALAIGACTSAFRLVDALLLRPLPVADPDRLCAISYEGDIDGKHLAFDEFAYPLFRQMRALVKGHAELIAVGNADRVDLTFGFDQETEKAYVQYVSGWMFSSFGLRPALGRLLTENDDLKPRAHPYAALSYDYWTRRFGQDPKIIGRKFRMGNDVYEIVGVVRAPFTGTEPGTAVDIFVPTMMMNNATVRSDYNWFRTFVRLKPGVAPELARDRLRPAYRAFQQERAQTFTGMPKHEVDAFLKFRLMLRPAAAGISVMQRDYRVSLAALGVLVALVLLIACANVANLMTAQAAARAREMALRVSIGAGRARLVQLVLVEGAILALLAAAIGGGIAWWSAPFVVSRINPPDNPARLVLPADWRVFGFGLALTFAVTLLFGLAPALRASAVKPASALKGGEDPHARRRLMHALITAQVAFCFLVLFGAGLFVDTFDRLSKQPTGFSAARLLTLETLTPTPQPSTYWEQVADHLRALPGVEQVAISEWPLMTGESWSGFISVNGMRPSETDSYFLSISPEWRHVMRIPLIAGRDFRPSNALPGTAIVNKTFARQYLGLENPVGRSFDVVDLGGPHTSYQIVGLVADARYKNMREPMQAVAYFPFKGDYSRGTFIVRTTSSNPLVMASMLRREVPRARPEFRVSTIRTQKELIESHTVRERLLAMLALFFAAVALLLATIGLYGVLNYSVLQRRREIGIRMAIGAPAADIARRVTVDVLTMVLLGSVIGLALGLASVRYIESLLYQVRATDVGMLAVPWLTVPAVTFLAAVPAVIRAVRIDPMAILRAE